MRRQLRIRRNHPGWPVIVQAGSSDAGRQASADPPRSCSPSTATSTAAARCMPTSRAASPNWAATPSISKILPGAPLVISNSLGRGTQKRAKLDSLVHYDSAHRLAVDRAGH